MIGRFFEDSQCCERICCKSNRSFSGTIQDYQNSIMFQVQRPLKCPGICQPSVLCGLPMCCYNKANDWCWYGQTMTVLDGSANLYQCDKNLVENRSGRV